MVTVGLSLSSGYNGSIEAAPKVETGRGCMRVLKYNIVLPVYDVDPASDG